MPDDSALIQPIDMTGLANENIRTEFQRRDSVLPADFYSLSREVNLFFYHGRVRESLRLLRRVGFFPCHEKKVLEVGCGARGWLPDFETWGVLRSNLAGIELDEERVRTIRQLLSGSSEALEAVPMAGADIRTGDAGCLPWEDGTFDAIVQSTVFSSILSEEQQKSVAGEILRVMKPDGFLLWYDFVYNNPANPNVRGVPLARIKQLFPDCDFLARSATLAPPIARRIVPWSWLLAEVLQAARLLNTHRVIIIRKKSSAS